MTRGPTRTQAWRLGLWVIGLLVTAVVGLHVYESPGVYWARTVVRLYAPDSAVNPNKLQISSGALIETAGVLTRTLNNGPSKETLPVDPGVTIVDRGIDDGATVFQPNNGGQWAINYTIPVVIVDVAAPDAITVTKRTEKLVGEVQSALERIQADAGVRPQNLVTARPESKTASVQYSDGNRPLALVVTLALGLAVTSFAAGHLSRFLGSRRRARRSPATAQVPNQL